VPIIEPRLDHCRLATILKNYFGSYKRDNHWIIRYIIKGKIQSFLSLVIVIGCIYQEEEEADRPGLLTEEVRFQL
jgi:hypothetical protein